MKRLFVAVFAISLGSAAAHAQAVGPTCSGYHAGCNQNCQNMRNASGCHAICNNLFNTCMQTGSWERRDGTTVTNLQRR